ncbi:Retrovirus-related Pol polyprotein from transposon 17.6, partial [Mucuna pruriens]
MTVVKNQNDELVPTIIQNNYRKLNQATRKDHFPFLFIDQVLERLASKSHYCFVDVICRFILHQKINIRPPSPIRSAHLPTLGCCSACTTPQTPSKESCIKVFMDNFMVYSHPFGACLESLSKVLDRCIKTNLVLNFGKCHFMVTEGIILRHLVSNKGIEVGKAKIDIICAKTYTSRTLDSTQANYSTIENKLLAIAFVLDKFCSNLLGSKIVVFSDHAALKFLLKKPDVKPRLIRWMFLLQEFDIEIKDKSGVENLITNHLSRIEGRIDPLPIRDDFPDEQLMQLDDVYRTMRSSHCSNFVASITDRTRQLRRYWIVGFIGPSFLRLPTTSLPPTSNAKEQEWPLPIDMRCPNSSFFFVRSLMFR